MLFKKQPKTEMEFYEKKFYFSEDFGNKQKKNDGCDLVRHCANFCHIDSSCM